MNSFVGDYSSTQAPKLQYSFFGSFSEHYFHSIRHFGKSATKILICI
jgi:hypothetical protein